MTPLPIDLQGYLHIIQIPLEAGRLPLAFVCYLRPKRIGHDSPYDIVDNKIFEAIQNKYPAASRRYQDAIVEEQLESATASFHLWWPYAINIFQHTSLPNQEPQIDIYQPLIYTRRIVRFRESILSLYTRINVDQISNNIIRYPDSPEVDNWNSQLSPYLSLLDRVYPVELTDQEFVDSATLSPVIDIKRLVAILRSNY